MYVCMTTLVCIYIRVCVCVCELSRTMGPSPDRRYTCNEIKNTEACATWLSCGPRVSVSAYVCARGIHVRWCARWREGVRRVFYRPRLSQPNHHVHSAHTANPAHIKQSRTHITHHITHTCDTHHITHHTHTHTFCVALKLMKCSFTHHTALNRTLSQNATLHHTKTPQHQNTKTPKPP